MVLASGAKKILVVDDEPDLVELVTYNLSKEGYTVAAARTGEEAITKMNQGTYDLVVLDLMLPGMQGTEICRAIRENPDTADLPVIMLTAKTEDTDKIIGLELGADDYMTKPFNPREFVARVKAVLRRTKEPRPQKPAILKEGGIEIHEDEYKVYKDGLLVDLSPTEYRLLLFLAERKGKVYNRDQLLDLVWKGEAYVEPRTVDVHIRRLRMQIEDDPSEPRYIKTRRGVGYYFEGEA